MSSTKCAMRMLAMFVIGAIVAGVIVFLRMDQYIMKTQREIKAKIKIIEAQRKEINEEIGEAIADFNIMEYERRRMTDLDLMQYDPVDTLRKSRTRLMTLKRLRGLSIED